MLQQRAENIHTARALCRIDWNVCSGPDSVRRRCRLHACRDSGKPVEASEKKRPPRYATPGALALPKCVRVHREHISLRRLKVFSSCGKAPASACCRASLINFAQPKERPVAYPFRVGCREVQMNIASIFDWFAQDSAYAAEHTDEPRQRGMWLQFAEQWEAAALQASNEVEAAE